MVMYIDEKEEITTDDYILAYIDILGTKAKVKSAKNEEYMKIVKSLYQNAFKYCETINNIYQNFLENCYVRIFSDNILILYKCTKEHLTIPTLENLFGFVAVIQATALYNNILTRGAISMGKTLVEDIFIHGEALVDVVEAEEHIAKYPRVILCKKIIDECLINIDSEIITTDYDGYKYINYYTMLTKTMGNRITDKELMKIKNFLTKERFKNHKDEKIKEKIEWMIQYHNFYVSKLIGTWGITEEQLIMPANKINKNIITRKNTEPSNAK